VLEGKTIIVEDAQPDPFRETIEQVTRQGDTGRAFICAPLVARAKTIGALVVDNRFLTSERDIDESIIDCLEAFASLIAMSIENARLRARFAEEQRLETWREFTARIAHIVGTRTSVIEGAVTRLRFCLLEEGAATTEYLEDARALLEELTEGIRKAKVVVNDLRKFTAPLELRPEELDLGQLLKGVLGEVRHSLEFPVDLAVPDEPLIITADPTRLSDAFIELIKNAEEAMQQGTNRPPRLTIAATAEAAPAGSGALARIEFADTGRGILEADKEHIFKPYYSTKGRSSGLGLTNVKITIEEHEGTIEEIGEYGEGARFVVRVPVVGPNPYQKGERNGQDPCSGR